MDDSNLCPLLTMERGMDNSYLHSFLTGERGKCMILTFFPLTLGKINGWLLPSPSPFRGEGWGEGLRQFPQLRIFDECVIGVQT
jgi:hypothetical protein